MRGEVYRLRTPRDGRGQAGARFAVVVQSDQLPLSTRLVEIEGQLTRVLAEQTAAIDPGRLGASSGTLTFEELRRVEAALRLVLDL